MRLGVHRPARELRRILAALGLTVTIFGLPVWTVAVHEPHAETFSSTPPSADERIAQFVMTLPPPAPEAPPFEEPPPAEDEEEDAAQDAPTAEEEAPAEDRLADAPPPAEAAPAAASVLLPKARLRLAERPLKMAASTEAVEPPEPTRADSKPSQKSRKTSRKKKNCRPDVPEITASSGREDYAVARALIDRYAKDLDAAAGLAHVAWARDAEDRVIGFKVVRIRCGSPLHEAGFKNGDVITRINGHKVRTVPQALAAYIALRTKRKLRIRGNRKDGAEMDLRYRLT